MDSGTKGEEAVGRLPMGFPFSDGVEVKSMYNQYKRRDVFLCPQESHKGFDGRVSVYHVLKEKRCYPHGCVSFQWECVRLSRGSPCSRGFRRAGRLCFGCRFFLDEKIVYQPRVVLTKERFEAFRGELEEFESWLEGLRGREVNYSGTVFSVKPRLLIDPSRSWRPSFWGFLVVFHDGFVNMVHLRDFCYLRVSGRVQERYRFRTGDRLDFFARLVEDRGRIVLTRVNRVEIEHRAEGFWWNESRARVALRTGALLVHQPGKCLDCEQGCLVDVKRGPSVDTGIHRRLFCLAGVENPWSCPHVESRGGIADEYGNGKCGFWERDGSTVCSRAALGRALSCY